VVSLLFSLTTFHVVEKFSPSWWAAKTGMLKVCWDMTHLARKYMRQSKKTRLVLSFIYHIKHFWLDLCRSQDIILSSLYPHFKSLLIYFYWVSKFNYRIVPYAICLQNQNSSRETNACSSIYYYGTITFP